MRSRSRRGVQADLTLVNAIATLANAAGNATWMATRIRRDE
ncbi:MAG: hypothetical protein AVDCRST_MAG87-2260 [uncultured Thermomicrobiales bacterium]|uniref:Uncharacterized protein n=1 Tax=uncultured Thermomicrobiales bacterium TaxID=1645740 RepID=A0A6J4V5P4_9BACT|nr:MAG: hypothetical protein AVDCRST_MAG87-2260 [uncultured Thermomicrobiales bacterium]